MKKKLFSAALILAAVVSFNASASQSASTQDVKEITSKVEEKATELGEKAKDFGKKAEKSIKKEGKKLKGDRKGGRDGQRPDLFKGIDLSAEQKAQLEALRPQRPEGAPRGEKKIKGAKAACDSAACPAKAACDKKCDKAACDKKDGKGPKADIRREGRKGHPAMREEYVNKVKEILTPEQFEVFQKNLSELRDNGNHHRHGDKK